MDISRSDGSVSVCRPEKAVRATEKQTSANTAHNHMATAAEIFMHRILQKKTPGALSHAGRGTIAQATRDGGGFVEKGYCRGPSHALLQACEFLTTNVVSLRHNGSRRASPHRSLVNLVRSGRKQPQPVPASAGGQARQQIH